MISLDYMVEVSFYGQHWAIKGFVSDPSVASELGDDRWMTRVTHGGESEIIDIKPEYIAYQLGAWRSAHR